MLRLSLALAAVSMIAAPVGAAAPCRDAKTHRFIKCPPVVKVAVVGVTKDKTGRCHVASGPKKGQFTKCP